MTTLAEAIDALNFDLGSAANPIPDPVHQSSDIVAPLVMTYQFESSQPGDLWRSYSGWNAMSAAEKQFYTDTLAYVETIVNIDFQEVSGQADPDMNVGKVTLPGSITGEGGFNYSYTIPFGAPAYITEYDQFTVFETANLVGQTALILHEIGHALSMKHPFSGTPVLPASLDSNKYTVMSYTANPDNGMDTDGYLAFDIATLQQRWGANMNTATGNDSYTGPRNNTVDAIWDAGGTDIFDASAIATAVILDLNEGAFSRFGTYDDVTIAYGVVIENATGGSGNDTLNGNSSANVLDGGAGIDILNGAAGNDILLGGGDNDTLNGDAGNDTLDGGAGADILDGGADIDTADFSGGTNTQTINLGTNINIGGYAHGDTLFNIENIKGSLTHTDRITGNSGNNTLEGQGGFDQLRGHHGDDMLYGGEGNDTLYGGTGADLLDGGTGTDWAMYNGLTTGITVNLTTGIGSGGDAAGDTYVDIERVRGTLVDDTIMGDGGNNRFLGDAGADTLNGMGGRDDLRGGLGNDTINGGTGKDSLRGEAGLDTFVYENGSEHDWIIDFENNTDTINIDSALYAGTLTAAEVVDTYLHLQTVNRFYFDFGGGDVLHVLTGSNLALNDFYDDVTIV